MKIRINVGQSLPHVPIGHGKLPDGRPYTLGRLMSEGEPEFRIVVEGTVYLVLVGEWIEAIVATAERSQRPDRQSLPPTPKPATGIKPWPRSRPPWPRLWGFWRRWRR